MISLIQAYTFSWTNVKSLQILNINSSQILLRKKIHKPIGIHLHKTSEFIFY